MELYTLIEFAEAYERLGSSVQNQLRCLLDQQEDADLNPNAVELMKTLYPNLADIDPELEDELRETIESWSAVSPEEREERLGYAGPK